jgi:retinol dehydrogenase-12
VLTARGAKVYMGARSKERAEEAIAEIKKETGKDNIHWLPMDLANLATVKEAAEEFKKYTKKTKQKKLFLNTQLIHF